MQSLRLLFTLSACHGVEHWYGSMLGPLLPFIARDLGLSLSQVGALLALRSLAWALASGGAGAFFDMKGKGRTILFTSLVGLSLSMVALGFARSFFFLILLLPLTGIFTHIWHPPAMALLGNSYRDRRGFAFGIHSGGANLGYALGPLFIGYLLLSHGWRPLIVANAMPGIAVAFLLLALIPPFGSPEVRREGGWSHLKEGVIKNHRLLALSLIGSGRWVAFRGAETFLPFLVLRELGLSSAWVGVYLLLLSLSSTLPEPLVGAVSDRLGRRPVMAVGMAVGGLALALAGRLPHGLPLVVAICAAGVFLLALRSVIFAFGFELTPPELGASTVGYIFTMNSAMSGMGPLVGGYMADLWGLPAAFLFFGGVAVLAGLLSLLLPSAKPLDRPGLPRTGDGS